MGLKRIYPKPTDCRRTTERSIGFTRICCEMCRSCGPTKLWASDHHLRAHAAGLDVLDGGHGLVQSLCVVVAVVEYFGRTVLPGGVGGGAVRRARPEIFNTDQGVQYTAEAFTAAWRRRACGVSNGRPWPVDGQRVRGAIVADGEI